MAGIGIVPSLSSLIILRRTLNRPNQNQGDRVMSEKAATTPTKAAKNVQKSRSLAETRTRFAWILLIPTLLVVAIVGIYPLLQTFYLSLTDARLGSLDPTQFIGFENYAFLFTDSAFFTSIWNTIFFTIVTVMFEFVLGMIIALVINSQFKGRGMMRAAMLVPWAIPTVISAQMWKWMYHDTYGVINDFLANRLHLVGDNITFLGIDTTLAIVSIAMVDIWKTTPFVALLLLAGLQVIPGDVYEAAEVDGASTIQKFLFITLPLLRPAILVALIFRTLDALRVFDVFYVMFGQRPDTQTMAIYAQQNLVDFSDLGYGSAISVAIFLIIAIFVVMYVTFLKVEDE
jgi:trehalose/maltose transport system permease protein